MIVKVEWWKIHGNEQVPQQRVFSDVRDYEFFPHQWALVILNEDYESKIVGFSLNNEANVKLDHNTTMRVRHHLYDVVEAKRQMDSHEVNYRKLKHVVLYRRGDDEITDFVITNNASVFIMNDEGKTIDKLL